MMESDKAPRGFLGGGKVVFHPLFQFGFRPIRIGITVEDRPMGISVVERKIGHPGEAVASRREEIIPILLIAGECGKSRGTQTIERLKPVIEIRERIWPLGDIA